MTALLVLLMVTVKIAPSLSKAKVSKLADMVTAKHRKRDRRSFIMGSILRC